MDEKSTTSTFNSNSYLINEEQRQMKRVAFFAIVVSTVAVIASVVTLPMIYSYVASFQSHLIMESDFCKVC